MVKGIKKPHIYWSAYWGRWCCHWHGVYYGWGATPAEAYTEMRMRTVEAGYAA